ncbi:MAG: MerR family DNA-binding transcriptional regulator [Candidatus Staskawiczbacteria bacterium]|nr:MerR family DNA-binding transcriptional regulator [Candidatus Staskawiczbacteria bacterium]MBI3337491.1 MerR family DNA-binding transcriptional regulator [Candidatus Staskawiczbacteria bacterium]
MENNEDLILIGDAAEILGVSINTLRRWDESGRLSSVRKQPGGNRYYRRKDLEVFKDDLFRLAEEWAVSETELPKDFYCQDSSVFLARITKMTGLMIQNKDSKDLFSLLGSVAGEIGNNSYDHNLGKWPDVHGIFFGFDLNKKQIVLADRGVGILETLKRVRPELKDHKRAVEVAFTEIISGREPEARGNGLKYVRNVISKNPINLQFQTGDAELTLHANSSDLNIKTAKQSIRGCLALITY